MSIGVVGKKIGMTRIFTDEGGSIPVTVIEVQPNVIAQVKSQSSDGYDAIQVTTGSRKATRINKASAGHFSKAGINAGRGLWEFRVEGDHEFAVGGEVNADMFSAGQKVDVTGVTLGKGYAGVLKRHHFAGKDASHGNSINHRTPGSIGQCQTQGRVFKGKKMTGHLGNVRRTQQNLEVVRIDEARRLLLVKGAVPGSKGGDVLVRPAVKTKA